MVTGESAGPGTITLGAEQLRSWGAESLIIGARRVKDEDGETVLLPGGGGITVDNAAGVQHGVKAVTVDGKAICGNVLPLAAAGTEVTVQVTMG